MKKVVTPLFALLALATLTACSPEPGTKAWCEKMKETPKGDWSANDAGTFTKYCVLGNSKEK